MDNASIKARICNILESVVEKTESINKSKEPDSLIEIDLVLDELKQLYKDFALLKKLTERQLEKGADVHKAELGSTDTTSRTFPRTFVTPPPAKKEQQDDGDLPKAADKVSDSDGNDTKVTSAGDEKKDDSLKEKGPESVSAKNEAETKANSSEGDQKYDYSSSGHTNKQHSGHKADFTAEPQQTANKKESEKNNFKSKNKSVADTVNKKQNNFIADKYTNQEDTSLNVRLAKMKENVDIGTRMQQKPINNLRDSIGVNEKFLFINELFEGDIEAYNEAVNKLNSFDNLDEAFDYINQLNDTYSWDGQHSAETIDKFAHLVQRRYMTN